MNDEIVHFRVTVPIREVYSKDMNVVEATCSIWKKGVPQSEYSNQLSQVTVSIYRLDESSVLKRRKHHKNMVNETTLNKQLIETRNVSVVGNEWVVFNVTSTVETWVLNPSEDTAIIIKCPDCEAAGVHFQTGGDEKVPVLDVKTHIAARRRIKRSRYFRRGPNTRRRGRKTRKPCQDGNKRGRRSSKCCQRKSMKVKFSDLKEFDFIMAPSEFDAYYCSGKCPAKYKVANAHAKFQSLLNMRNKREVPKPCCAPTELQSLDIVIRNEEGKVEIKVWNDMIVTECGCS